jgi:chromosome segregation ATPase
VTPLRAEIKALQSDVEELRDDKMSLKEDKRHLQADKAMFAETMNGLRNDKAKLESDKSKLEQDKSKLEQDKSKLQEDKSGLQLDKERYAPLIENLEEHLAYMHLKERQFLEHGYRTHDIFEGECTTLGNACVGLILSRLPWSAENVAKGGRFGST